MLNEAATVGLPVWGLMPCIKRDARELDLSLPVIWNTGRRWPRAPRKERPQKQPDLPTLILDSTLQNCGHINVCRLSQTVAFC